MAGETERSEAFLRQRKAGVPASKLLQLRSDTSHPRPKPAIQTSRFGKLKSSDIYYANQPEPEPESKKPVAIEVRTAEDVKNALKAIKRGQLVTAKCSTDTARQLRAALDMQIRGGALLPADCKRLSLKVEAKPVVTPTTKPEPIEPEETEPQSTLTELPPISAAPLVLVEASPAIVPSDDGDLLSVMTDLQRDSEPEIQQTEDTDELPNLS